MSLLFWRSLPLNWDNTRSLESFLSEWYRLSNQLEHSSNTLNCQLMHSKHMSSFCILDDKNLPEIFSDQQYQCLKRSHSVIYNSVWIVWLHLKDLCHILNIIGTSMSLLLLCTSVPQDTSYIFRHTVTDTLVVPGCTFNKKLPEYNCTHTWYKNWERGKRRREEEWPLPKKRGGDCLSEGWAGRPRMPPSELTLPASSLLSLLRWVLRVGHPYKIILRFPWTLKQKPCPYCFLPRTHKMIKITQLWRNNSIGLNGFYATLYHNVIAGDWKN